MKCELCDSDRCNTIQYGEFLKKNGKGVHTNCLYLSSGLIQAGSENEGFLGFLPKDIAAERARASKIKCCFCGKMRASIGCCEVRCYRSFHMICGIERGAMNQFLDTFRSFCDRHVRKMKARPKPEDKCCICYEKIFNENKSFSSVKMIRAPCCKNGWFHKICLQTFAKSAGYFFKCPLCNDCQKFRTNMSLWGIFVQDKDAEWELVPNAYAELLERPGVCGAKICNNAEGRSQCNNLNPFLYCATCGSVTTHRRCMPQGRSTFECDNCKEMLKNDSEDEIMQQYAGEVNGHKKDGVVDENSDVDVCGDTDNEISSNNQEEASHEAIERPNIKNRTVFQITDTAEESSIEDLVLKGSSHRMAANKRDIIDEDSESDSFSGDEADCSENEGLVDIFVQEQKTPNSYYHKTEKGDSNMIISSKKPTRRIRSNKETQNGEGVSSLNVSCIAQRTRRKSIAMGPPSLNEELTADDVSSTSSYQPLKSTQVFQFDDEDNSNVETTRINEERIPSIGSTIVSTTSYTQSDSDSDAQSRNDTNVGRGLLDYFYALLHEVKQSKSMDRPNNASIHVEEADIEDKGIVDHAKERQSNNRKRRRKLDRKETYKHFKCNETNSLDISCIGNRTRRRSLPNMQSIQTRSLLVDHAECDNILSINSVSPCQSSQTHEILHFSEESKVLDGLNNNCKADITRRLTRKVNVMETIKESDVDAEEQNNLANVSCIAKRTRKSFSLSCASNHNGKANNSSAMDHPNNIANNSNSTTSSTKSFKSTTYFSRTFEYPNENVANWGETASNAIDRNKSIGSKRLNTIADKEEAKQNGQMTHKRKSVFDSPKSSKIPALSNDESAHENHKNILELSCIANKTRRMSADKNLRKEINDVTKNKEAFASDNEQAAHITTKLIKDSTPEHKSNDIINSTTPSANSSSSSIVLPSGSKRGQRIRMRPRRFLYSDDEWDNVTLNVIDSPIPKTPISNIMGMNDAYIMPKYTRVNVKLKRVSAETLPQQQRQLQTMDAQKRFARSYNLLLYTANDSLHTSISST